MKASEARPKRQFIVRFEKGEEIVSAIERFAREKNIGFASISLIGAAENITLGYLQVKPENVVIKHSFTGSHEFLGIGNLSMKEGKHSAHLHAFIGTKEKDLHGGHLVSAQVSVTIEGIVQEVDKTVGRKIDPSVNYPVLDLGG